MPDEPIVEDPIVEQDPEPEGVITDPHTGEKRVPLAAVQGERERRKALETRLKDMEAQFQQLEPIRQKASQVDQLTGELRSVKEQLQQFQPKPQGPQVSDEEAAEFARNYELYNAQTSQLDLERAKKIILRNRSEAVKIADERVKEHLGPIQAESAASGADAQLRRIASTLDPATGEPLVKNDAFRAILAAKWRDMPAHLVSRPEVADTVLQAAYGEYQLSQKRVPRSEREPVFTETPGGSQQGRYQITDLERKFAKDHGMTTEKWTERAKQFQPGQINVLE